MRKEDDGWSDADISFRQIHSSGNVYENIQTFKNNSIKYFLRKDFVFIFYFLKM